MEGLEPPHLTASDPKSDVSTNFTTCAFGAAKVMDLDYKLQLLPQLYCLFSFAGDYEKRSINLN
jgi:hypothetical protein